MGYISPCVRCHSPMCLAMVVGRSTGHAKSLGNSGSDGGQYEYMGDRIGALRELWYVDNIAVERFVICSLSMCFIFSFVFIRCAIWKRFNKNSPAAATTTTTTISAVQRRAGLPHTHTHRYKVHTHRHTCNNYTKNKCLRSLHVVVSFFFVRPIMCSSCRWRVKGGEKGTAAGALRC